MLTPVIHILNVSVYLNFVISNFNAFYLQYQILLHFITVGISLNSNIYHVHLSDYSSQLLKLLGCLLYLSEFMKTSKNTLNLITTINLMKPVYNLLIWPYHIIKIKYIKRNEVEQKR